MWHKVSLRQRRYRLLKELIDDAKTWVEQPWTNFYRSQKTNRHPDMPKRPLSTYMMFYMEKKDRVSKEYPNLEMVNPKFDLIKRFCILLFNLFCRQNSPPSLQPCTRICLTNRNRSTRRKQKSRETSSMIRWPNSSKHINLLSLDLMIITTAYLVRTILSWRDRRLRDWRAQNCNLVQRNLWLHSNITWRRRPRNTRMSRRSKSRNGWIITRKRGRKLATKRESIGSSAPWKMKNAFLWVS